MSSNRLNQIVAEMQTALRITLGQVDNALLSTMVQCGDALAITRYGRVEAYVIPVDQANDLANALAVLLRNHPRHRARGARWSSTDKPHQRAFS